MAGHPYRQVPSSEPPSEPPEELVIYMLIGAVGAIPVASALSRGDDLGAEPTIGLMLLTLGMAGVFAAWRAARRARRRRRTS